MTLYAVPARTVDQRMQALQKANETRTLRAGLKRDLRAGRTTAADILLAPPPWALTMKTVDVLLAVPKIGRVKTEKAFRRCKVSPSKTLGGMTMRQRLEILVELGLYRQAPIPTMEAARCA